MWHFRSCSQMVIRIKLWLFTHVDFCLFVGISQTLWRSLLIILNWLTFFCDHAHIFWCQCRPSNSHSVNYQQSSVFVRRIGVTIASFHLPRLTPTPSLPTPPNPRTLPRPFSAHLTSDWQHFFFPTHPFSSLPIQGMLTLYHLPSSLVVWLCILSLFVSQDTRWVYVWQLSPSCAVTFDALSSLLRFLFTSSLNLGLHCHTFPLSHWLAA